MRKLIVLRGIVVTIPFNLYDLSNIGFWNETIFLSFKVV